jgi:hypothetical protein
MSWEITKQDAANYIACADRASWSPTSFEPPKLEVVNPALSTHRSDASVRCAFLEMILHSRIGCHWIPRMFASSEHACGQWHSSRVVNYLSLLPP